MSKDSKFPTGIEFINYKKVKPFWTKREYQYQQLVINGFAVQRETLPDAQYKRGKEAIPKARIDIYYDTGKGIGSKKINGYEIFVYKEAIEFLDPGEKTELDKQWKQAYVSGYFNYDDPYCKEDLFSYKSSSSLPAWFYFGRAYKKDYPSTGKATEKKDWSYKKDYPLRDLFLTQKIDAKEVVEKKDLSTFYKHIRGDLELTKRKALEYGAAINVAPQSLMFEPTRIIIWGNVNLTHNVTFSKEPNFPEIHTTGSIYFPKKFETVIVPSDLYRVDVKAVKVKSKESIYDGFVAYYYETDKVSDSANNKLCLVREWKNKNHAFYLGIYQIYGTKKRVLNPDPTSENKIIAADVDPDLVAPIISFTKPDALEADKMLSKNLRDTQKLGTLIREEEKNRIKLDHHRKLILSAADKVYKARQDTDKNYKKSEEILKDLSKKQERFDADLQNLLAKFHYKEEKKEADKDKANLFSKFLFKNKEGKEYYFEPIELPDDYELPKEKENKIA